MGVPRFFSWYYSSLYRITRRYPMILEDLEEYPLPEIDCLYLDMNGIIYKCSKVPYWLMAGRINHLQGAGYES